MSELIAKYGSIRRMFEAYWMGQCSIEEEDLIENSIPPERIYGFKPVPQKQCGAILTFPGRANASVS